MIFDFLHYHQLTSHREPLQLNPGSFHRFRQTGAVVRLRQTPLTKLVPGHQPKTNLPPLWISYSEELLGLLKILSVVAVCRDIVPGGVRSKIASRLQHATGPNPEKFPASKG